jgi:DnaK suppressor protein
MDHNTLDANFLERKRQELLNLQQELQRVMDSAEAEENDLRQESGTTAREYEDDAQKLDMLEKDGNLVRRAVVRLARVERALGKIADGTYGYSDLSGERIPDERLEALPDAINTVNEQTAGEAIP